MYSSIAQAVQGHAQQIPDHLAVADVERAYTYEELAVAASQAVKVLQEIGIKEKDAVLVECTQKATFLILDLACEQIGAVFIPLERKMTEARVCSIYEETEAKCVIAETVYEVAHFCSLTDLLEKMEMQPHTWEAYEEKNPVAEILFTTGTTGQPKGIVISHQANIAIAENIQYGTQMTGQTVELVPMPLSHSHGLRTCYANLLNGSAVVLLDGVMNIALFFEMIEKFGVNALDLSPTLAKLLLKIARRGLVKYSQVIDYIEIGTAFLDDELKGKLKEIFPSSRLYNFYGSTEAGRSCVLDFNQMDFTGCIGYPSKNAAFLIVDDEHHVMQSSKENPGLLAVRGPMMMDGYLGNEELTRTVLIDDVLYTNDLGYIDAEGRVYVLGRQDDVINYKGIKIAPEEIETVAMQYAGIKDCACIPVPDPVRGQVPKLYVAAAANYSEQELFMVLRNGLEATRVPVFIETTDLIPRSSNGKLQRKKLREYDEKK